MARVPKTPLHVRQLPHTIADGCCKMFAESPLLHVHGCPSAFHEAAYGGGKGPPSPFLVNLLPGRRELVCLWSNFVLLCPRTRGHMIVNLRVVLSRARAPTLPWAPQGPRCRSG